MVLFMQPYCWEFPGAPHFCLVQEMLLQAVFPPRINLLACRVPWENLRELTLPASLLPLPAHDSPRMDKAPIWLQDRPYFQRFTDIPCQVRESPAQLVLFSLSEHQFCRTSSSSSSSPLSPPLLPPPLPPPPLIPPPLSTPPLLLFLLFTLIGKDTMLSPSCRKSYLRQYNFFHSQCILYFIVMALSRMGLVFKPSFVVVV